MINESVLRKQLATTKTIFDWMKSWEDEIQSQVDALREEASNVMYIDMTNMESFKKSVEAFKEQHPNSDIKATGFLFSLRKPELNQSYTYPETISKDKEITKEIPKMAKAKTTKKSKPKTTKKSKK
jgi:hypothetical protein